MSGKGYPLCATCTTRHLPRCRNASDLRWPAAPLMAKLGTEGVSQTSRSLLSLSGTVAKRWMARGLTDREADHAACKLGLHPGSIWPDWFDRGLSPRDERFINGTGWRQSWEWAERDERQEVAA